MSYLIYAKFSLVKLFSVWATYIFRKWKLQWLYIYIYIANGRRRQSSGDVSSIVRTCYNQTTYISHIVRVTLGLNSRIFLCKWLDFFSELTLPFDGPFLSSPSSRLFVYLCSWFPCVIYGILSYIQILNRQKNVFYICSVWSFTEVGKWPKNPRYLRRILIPL